MQKIKSIYNHRFSPLIVLAFILFLLSFITRIILFIKSWPNLEFTALQFIGIFFIGFFYDIVVYSFFAIPVALYCWLMKDSWYQKKWQRILFFIFFFLIILILVANVGGEIIFWNEFNVRYNFIAVDYLVYTTEVLGNIWESFNIPLIVGVIFSVTAAILFFVQKKLNASQGISMRFGKRSIFFFVFMLFPIVHFFFS